jgi:hypothetical protein
MLTRAMNPVSATASRAIENFRRYWAGNGELADAYWGYGFAGGWILTFALIGLGLLLFPNALTHYNDALFSPIFRGYLIVARLTLWAYQGLVCILIWRNAKNASIPLWKHVARIYVGAFAFLFVIKLYRSL